MDFIIAGIFLIISLYLITQPLFNPNHSGDGGELDSTSSSGDRHAILQAKKRLLDENITDLEFEYRMGKLSKEDYDRLQSGWDSEASRLKEALAEFRADRTMDERIEQDIRNRRKLG